MSEGPTISTHVLDTQRGRPAEGVEVILLRVADGGEAIAVGRGTTDVDGRIRRLLDAAIEAGQYRIEFRLNGPFFESFSTVFRVADPGRSYHVPLLLSPYSMSTYLGS
jgi:5-hydroxyisourate hydrolase